MSKLPEILPPNGLHTQWLKVAEWRSHWVDRIFAEYERCAKASGWSPKVVFLNRPIGNTDVSGWRSDDMRAHSDLVMLDVCGHMQTGLLPASIKVATLEDHPFLRRISSLPNVPRAVKSIYRKDVRLAHERAHEAWPALEALDRAQRMWCDYLRSIRD